MVQKSEIVFKEEITWKWLKSYSQNKMLKYISSSKKKYVCIFILKKNSTKTVVVCVYIDIFQY